MAVVAALVVVACAEPACLPVPPLAPVRPGQVVTVRWGDCPAPSAACVVVTGKLCAVTLDTSLARLDPMVAWWVIGHELGHCADLSSTEIEADCYGARWLAGWGDVDVEALAEAVIDWPASSSRHPDGASRAQALRACSW